MEQYTVTGMSCAACSARVEKAVSGVPGVTSCAVSLLTNSMGVEGTASPAAIVEAVEKAGYGAVPKGAEVIYLDDGENGFYHVSYQGQEGYIYGRCMDLSTLDSQKAAAASRTSSSTSSSESTSRTAARKKRRAA